MDFLLKSISAKFLKFHRNLTERVGVVLKAFQT